MYLSFPSYPNHWWKAHLVFQYHIILVNVTLPNFPLISQYKSCAWLSRSYNISQKLIKTGKIYDAWPTRAEYELLAWFLSTSSSCFLISFSSSVCMLPWSVILFYDSNRFARHLSRKGVWCLPFFMILGSFGTSVVVNDGVVHNILKESNRWNAIVDLYLSFRLFPLLGYLFSWVYCSLKCFFFFFFSFKDGAMNECELDFHFGSSWFAHSTIISFPKFPLASHLLYDQTEDNISNSLCHICASWLLDQV